MLKFYLSYLYLLLAFLSFGVLQGNQGTRWLNADFKDLQDAANQNDPFAMGFLALVHIHGDKGQDISMQDALTYAEASAAKNHWLGHFALGYLARFAPYGPNPAMVKIRYLKAFQDPDGEMIREAAYKDPIAAYALAEIFTSDEVRPVVVPNLQMAASYYQVSSDLGYAPASVELALFKLGAISAPDLGISLDLAGGIKLLEKIAGTNLPSAHYYLGRSYFKGIGVEPDKGMALVHFQAAADRGNSISQLLVADFYAYGVSGPVKVDLALRYARLASEVEREKAQVKIEEYKQLLSAESRNLTVVPEPPEESAQSLETNPLLPSPVIPSPPPLPTEADRLPSIYAPSEPTSTSLAGSSNPVPIKEPMQATSSVPAEMILSSKDSAKQAYWGRGQPVDLKLAHSLFTQSANQGDGESARYLGMMFWQGKGVEKDLNQALRWFEVAAERGDSMAATNLQKLRGILGKK